MNYYRISILITLWMNGGRQGDNGFSDILTELTLVKRRGKAGWAKAAATSI